MKKLFAALGLSAILYGTVSAQSAAQEVLTAVTVCISVDSVEASVLGKANKLLADRIAFELERQLETSKVRYERTTDCTASKADFFISVDTSNSASATGGFVAWIVDVSILDWTTSHPVAVSIWDELGFGYTNDKGSDLENYLYGAAREAIESFTLAWRKANPWGFESPQLHQECTSGTRV